jgi:nucleoid-associated protein YgaU
MTRHFSITALILSLSLFFLLGGCAPAPRQELQNARMAVALADAAGARQYASDTYRKASENLKEGETLVRQGKYDLARKILSRAESDGRQAQFEARENQANQESPSTIEPEELTTREEVGVPPVKKQKKSVASLPPSRPRPAPIIPAPPPSPNQYTVTEGETLWTIAARKDIYFDSLLWPLIYKANRDQIKDPRQIYPGQVLNIPRDTSDTEKEEAREKARKSDIFPVQLLMKTNPLEGR